jgi:hypothetical protein
MTGTTAEVIEKNLQFAYNMCKDTNAYTAQEDFWDIAKAGNDELLKDKEYMRSTFPDLTWE